MKKSNTLALLAIVVGLTASQASSVHANMAPPEPFALDIGVSTDEDGLRINSIQQGSRAERAGLKVGDVILGIDGRYVKSMTPDEQQKVIIGRHTWQAELIVVRNRRDIMVIQVRG